MIVVEVTHLCENGNADVVFAGLVDEIRQLVRRYRSRDGFLSRLRRESDRQVLLVGQQIRASLPRDPQPIRKEQEKLRSPGLLVGDLTQNGVN